ncbi:hypothetical protein PIB30_075384 [Stylosanthes scabra]|uniref:Uncharacterized protein n=1 Tax=Stylosanthes scabra TaxID=79078 RepID=A0ABU6VP08_9FABA|nr:hypothetical protein [Stylosanthes scabra]
MVPDLRVRFLFAEFADSFRSMVSGVVENFAKLQHDNEKLKKQMEKLKRKHKMKMITTKQYLANSKLPEYALKPLYREDSDVVMHKNNNADDEDQEWRTEFGAIYQEYHY